MADNVNISSTGTTVVLADQLTDGTLGTGIAQYVKILDGTLDSSNKLIVNSDGSLNVTDPDNFTSGTLSATDAVVAAPAGTGATVTGTSTAGSYVVLAIGGGSASWSAQILGTPTGTYYFEESNDSTTGIDGTWINVNAKQSGIANTVLGYSTTTIGVFRGATAGSKYIRVRNVGGSSPTNTIIIRASGGAGAVFLNAALPTGTNVIGHVIADTGSTTAVTQATGTNLHAVIDSGTITTVSAVTAITNPLPAGTNVIGHVIQDSGNASLIPATSGGLSMFKLVSAATTNATSVKASAGQLYNIQAFNTNASNARFLKLYNKASAPTVGTDTPVMTLLIPSAGGGFIAEWTNGSAFSLGIAFAVTGVMTDADTTVIVASEVLINIQYK